MSLSNYLEDALVRHIVGKTAFSQLSYLYIALSTANPGEDGSSIAEPSGGAYVRYQIAPTGWAALSTGSLDNTGTVTFAQATASWGTITHHGIFDATTGGNFLGSGTLDSARAIGVGDTSEYADGAIVFSID